MGYSRKNGAVRHHRIAVLKGTAIETFRNAAGGDVLFTVYQPVDVCVGPGSGV